MMDVNQLMDLKIKMIDMKKLSFAVVYRPFLLFLFTLMTQVVLFAQEPAGGASSSTKSSSDGSSTTTTTTTTWYMQPWAWVLGGAILLLLIIALARGGSKDREVSKTTVIKTDKDYR
jgi:hypothetical protein